MFFKKEYTIDIPHFYCLEYKTKGKKNIVEIDFRDPIIYLSTSLIIKWNLHLKTK